MRLAWLDNWKQPISPLSFSLLMIVIRRSRIPLRVVIVLAVPIRMLVVRLIVMTPCRTIQAN